MTTFKDLGIEPTTQAFAGTKIKLEHILNREIIVQDYRIADSKLDGKQNEKCLYLQIIYNNYQHVFFTGAKTLLEMIERVPKSSFPIRTTIEKQNERLVFT